MKYSLMGAVAAFTIGASFAGAQQLPVSVQAEYEEGFGYLSAVRELPDGRVLVADPLGQILAAIDLKTGAMETWGREGGGPGEWKQPDAVFALPDGQTLLVDLGNGRLSTIADDGTFLETYPIARGGGNAGGGRRGGGAAGGRRMVMSSPTMLLPRVIDSKGGIYFSARSFGSPNDSTTVTRATLESQETTAYGKVKPQEMRQSSTGAGNVQITPLPMTARDDWAAGTDGTLVYVRSDGYYLEIVRPDGSTVRGPEQDVDLLRPSDDDKVAYLERQSSAGIQMQMSMNTDGERQMSMARGGGRGGDPDINQLEWPSRMPAFRAGSTAVAPDGRIFVGRMVHAGDPSLFDIFDQNGKLVGHTEFGPNTSIVGFGANGVIYITEADMFGLQWLKRVTVG